MQLPAARIPAAVAFLAVLRVHQRTLAVRAWQALRTSRHDAGGQRLLLAGRPDSDPMSGLTSSRMSRLIREASATFDWVVIDTPPVVLLPDANLLAAMVDAAILVVGAPLC